MNKDNKKNKNTKNKKNTNKKSSNSAKNTSKASENKSKVVKMDSSFTSQNFIHTKKLKHFLRFLNSIMKRLLQK